MKNKSIYGILLVMLMTTFWGCYPDGPDYIDEYDIVYTNYDDQFNFSGKKFYSIPDSVVKINGAHATGDELEFLSPSSGNLILNRLKSNMEARGYILTADTALADFFLVPSALEVTNVTYYYDYWNYYYGWYYGGYYGGWYYPYPITTSYTTGSIFTALVDKESANPSNRNRVVWLSIINGLLEGSSTDYPSRINKTIDQAFTQSTYLRP